MFIASEREFGSFNLNTFVFVWGLEMPRRVFPSPQAVIFQPELWCRVISMPYVMCRTYCPWVNLHFSNDSKGGTTRC